jgi:signal transduction histidine kinase/CheY-like chemotaxis protein
MTRREAPLEDLAARIKSEQIRLLYQNADTSIGITLVAITVLACLQWNAGFQVRTLIWLAYMVAVSAARWVFIRRYWSSHSHNSEASFWGNSFAIGAGLAGSGWGAAGIALYQESSLASQIFLSFTLGGMMLGAASLLAPRREAFIAFLVPVGIPTAIRFLIQGDLLHTAMGLLAALFTTATLLTTWRFSLTIASSLGLRFENDDLVANLRHAKQATELLNQELELRVEERTRELHESNQRLIGAMEQRKRAEEELLRVRKLDALGTLAGGIAHDFNNLITIIQGNIDLSQMKLGRAHPVAALLDSSIQACQRAASLASQLLPFSEGNSSIRIARSVSQLVQHTIESARVDASSRIDLNLPEDLWPAELDAAQIGHVLHAILLNAQDAMPQGGVIEVTARNLYPVGDAPGSDPPRVRISVRDHGPGIAADILPRIFDPYFTTKGAGRGLGLTVAHAIVVNHEGRLTVDAKVGEGSTFHIDLPAFKPSKDSLKADTLERSSAARVLVMDDEEPIRQLLLQTLETLGYRVETARDGAEALSLFSEASASQDNFDAVLLDLTVPGGMGGQEAASQLRAMDPSVKLIVSSGYSEAPVMAEYRKYGFDAVLGKPWASAQLTEVFQRVLTASP